jgi:predicted TIM-barrel fold metal-dependent hydrolase
LNERSTKKEGRNVDDDMVIDFRIRPPVRDTDQDPPVTIAPELKRYDDLYGLSARNNLPFSDLVEEMEKHSVRGVLQAEFEDQGRSRYWNERVATLVRKRPDLFFGGIAGVDPREPDALAELEWAHDDLGLRGLVVQPCFLGVSSTDERLYPLYRYCQERDVPVTIHCGVNFGNSSPMELGRPLLVDQLASDFPELTIIINHGGWPWVMEAVAIAWRQAHVFLDFGAVAPRYLADPNSGWAPITHWMRTQVSERIIFATDWPTIPYSRFFEDLPSLELPDEVSHRYLVENALELIGRSWPDHLIVPHQAPVEG